MFTLKWPDNGDSWLGSIVAVEADVGFCGLLTNIVDEVVAGFGGLVTNIGVEAIVGLWVFVDIVLTIE